MPAMPETKTKRERLHYLDAVRAFALLLGVLFHAALSFLPYPIGWAVMDVSTSPLIRGFFQVSHSFRMPLFFLIAGYFSHMSFHRNGGWRFLRSRLVRLGIPFVLGWFILWPLIVSGWVMGYASLRGDVEIWSGLKGGFAVLGNLPDGIFTSTHLWFLYYLLMITVLALCLRAVLRSSDRIHRTATRLADAALTGIASRSLGPLLPLLPTIGLLWLMRGWGIDTPDKSLLPDWPVLALYGGFFSLGWLFHRNPGSLEAFTRLDWVRVTVLVLSCAASVVLSRIQTDPSHPHYELARTGYVVSCATMMWACVILVTGLFRLLFRKPSRAIRYIADASYWIYLVHLPVVVWLQVAVAEWPLHWSIKLTLVFGATVGLALASYSVLVRPTWIGWVLNGRYRKASAAFAGAAAGRVILSSGS